jgi:hypothetical protein
MKSGIDINRNRLLTESCFEINGDNDPLMTTGFRSKHGKYGRILARFYVL